MYIVLETIGTTKPLLSIGAIRKNMKSSVRLDEASTQRSLKA